MKKPLPRREPTIKTQACLLNESFNETMQNGLTVNPLNKVYPDEINFTSPIVVFFQKLRLSTKWAYTHTHTHLRSTV